MLCGYLYRAWYMDTCMGLDIWLPILGMIYGYLYWVWYMVPYNGLDVRCDILFLSTGTLFFLYLVLSCWAARWRPCVNVQQTHFTMPCLCFFCVCLCEKTDSVTLLVVGRSMMHFRHMCWCRDTFGKVMFHALSRPLPRMLQIVFVPYWVSKLGCIDNTCTRVCRSMTILAGTSSTGASRSCRSWRQQPQISSLATKHSSKNGLN